MTRLLIARHGNTFAPRDIVRRVGTTDLPLVESGLQQGKNLGHFLRANELIPDVIFTSQLQRAKQTAEQVLDALQLTLAVKTLSIFNEIDYGPDENKPEEEVVLRLGHDVLKDWEAQAAVPPGWKVNPQEIISNWIQFAETINKQHPGKTVLVVTSNGIARFAPYLTGDFVAFSHQHGIKIATGALCIFDKRSNSNIWDCVKWNVRP